jgi:hypothetical protein
MVYITLVEGEPSIIGLGKDPYAMNEQIHELYRLENHFRAGVSVATDEGLLLLTLLTSSVMEACHQEKRRGRSFTD